MIKAIVYRSETGHTKAYAELLGDKIGLPVYELSAALKELPEKTEIIYLGWLMAGTVKGYKKASKRFEVKAVCGVGMSGGDSQLADMRKGNAIPESLPAFCLQGGFEMEKLRGVYRFMMNTMKKTVGKALSGKENRTPEENEMLDLLLNGGNRVCEEELSAVIERYKSDLS